MKKLILLLLILAVSATGAFAIELWLGPNAYYRSVIQPKDVGNADLEEVTLADFAFGAELRTYINLVSASAVAVYLPGGPGSYDALLIMTDVGVNAKLLFLRAGIGIGPDFMIDLTENGAVGTRAGGNLRLTGDLLLGDLSLGFSWVSRIVLSASGAASAIDEPKGHIGISILARL